MLQYKLTDENMKTYNGTQWKIGEAKEVSGEGPLCSSGWLHCYTHPLLAIFLNPIHANIKNPRLFECECKGNRKEENGLKNGWQKMTLTKEISLPKITLEQKIKFGILCALKACKEKAFSSWARNWLSGKNRSKEVARAAWENAAAAAEREANAAAARAANAAEVAERGANAAAWAARAAARAAWANAAAWAAARAANAAEAAAAAEAEERAANAAEAAARAAAAAANAADFDLIEIAKEAIK